MLLGIPLHVAFAYTAIEYQWLVKDGQNSYLVDWGLYFLRLFRMPLFFVISGFFSHYLIRRNPESFHLDRLKRLLIPLIVLFIVIVCPLRALWLFGEMMSAPEIFDFRNFLHFLTQNFFAPTTSRYAIPASWGHLWFLLYLYLFSVAGFWLRKIHLIKLNLISLMGLTFLSFYLMTNSWVDLPLGILPKPSLLVYYGIFYYYGWQGLNQIEKVVKPFVSYFMLGTGVLLGSLRAFLEVDSELGIGHFVFPNAALYVLSTLSTWLIIIGLIGAVKNLISRENLIISFFVKASYSIYLIHLPIIVIFQLLLHKTNFHWSLKFVFISSMTVLISSLIYKYLIQNKWPERFLKGQY